MTFANIGLSAALLRAVSELGYDHPTPVQSAAMPAILAGSDLWASAQTGSGKTAAFVLPILERLTRASALLPRPVRALIVVPTRELALQVGEAIERYAQHLSSPLKTCVVVGGVSKNPQMMDLRGGADIVVGTPGRLLDLVDEGALHLRSVQTLVLDEADRLLALGFADELDRLLRELPTERQTLLFSATFPPKVVALAELLLSDPIRINVDAGTAPSVDVLQQRVIEVDAGRRSLLLQHLLRLHAWPQVLVFVATRDGADELVRDLARAGMSVAALHSHLSQAVRTEALADFKARHLRVLVATDLAARGLDIAQLPAVVNYDLPRSAMDYVHRIGRTGRAGEKGMAVSFVSAASAAHFRLIEKRHKLSLEREQIPGFEPTDLTVAPRDVHGGVKGKRKSKKDKLREAAARAAGTQLPDKK